MISLFAFFWYLRTARALLFALYLWQLKEYHIGRFLDHFRTAKGKSIFFHPFVLAKIVLLAIWFFQAELALLLTLALYIGETALLANAARKKTLLFPVFTRKTIILIFSVILVQVLFLLGMWAWYLSYLVLALLLFDLFSLSIGSLVVLLWQPYAIFEKTRILKRAAEKRTTMSNLRVVGITGSYGKTSTKELLSHILSKKFVTLKTPEHKNSEMGIAHTILYDLTDEHQVFVCEMGAYNKGGIKLLADMARPTMGIVAGVNEQHLGIFGSGMNLFSAEGGGELVAALPRDAFLILNDDSKQLHELGPWLQLWNPNFANYFWCSAKAQKDLYAKNVKVQKNSVEFTAVLPYDQEAKFSVSAVGAQAIENILLAVGAANKLGMTLGECAEALKDFPLEANAMRLKKGKGGFDIIDSSYSANPSGVMAALEHLKLWEGKKIIVMPCLIELGSASRQVHVELGRKIGEIADFAIVTTKDQFAALQRGANERGMKKENLVFLEHAQQIVSRLNQLAKKGDVVLLEGRMPKGVADLLLQ